VSQLKKFLRTQQIGYHTLRFDIAPHGPVIDEWKTVLLKPVSAGMLAASRIPYYSAAADGPDRGSHYRSRLWDAVRQPAYMGRMLQNLLADGCNTFVEVGGKGSLAEMIDRRAAEMGTKAVVLPTMRIRESAHTVMSETETVLRRLGVLARPRANSARVSAG
jgi:acyl transferase domain-containing protein